MMQRLSLFLAVLASFALATSASALSIEGIVTCEGDGGALAGITVTASKEGASLSGTTDADGAYSIECCLTTGSWDMSVDTPHPVTGPASVLLDLSDPFQTDVDFVIDDPACAEPFCGDGILDPGEACDDGNNVDGDGCSAICTVESFCGDGILDPGEACDDGNNVDGDGCSSTCAVESFCGDGILDPGEECDDGNNVDGDGCSAMCTSEAGGEGCTPGYWRQRHHFDSYPAAYAPDTLFADAFGVDAFPGQTLSQVARAKGGQLNALGRHAVAALLNAASSDVAYDRTAAEVVESFQAAFASGDYEFLKNLFEDFNEQGCPLN